MSIGKYGGIAQLARAFGSYPKCRRFKSYFRYHIRPGGQAVKTPPFHGGNTSSILVRVTKHFLRQHRYKVRCCFTKCRCGGIGRHKGLKIPRTNTPYRFKSGHRHQAKVPFTQMGKRDFCNYIRSCRNVKFTMYVKRHTYLHVCSSNASLRLCRNFTWRSAPDFSSLQPVSTVSAENINIRVFLSAVCTPLCRRSGILHIRILHFVFGNLNP